MIVRFAALFACCCIAAAPSAMAQEIRFETTAPGGIVATGNTLGLSKQSDANGPGILGSIGTFLTLDGGQDTVPSGGANPWPLGTTNDWTDNGSSAVLSLPNGSTVLYAELVWGGSYQYGTEDVSASLGTSVGLAFGSGPPIAVTPDGDTAVTLNETAVFSVRYYLRSADVTSFVQAAGSGAYSVTGVPATQDTMINSLNAAGWTLVVAYRDERTATRRLAIQVGGSFVGDASSEDYVFGNFCAPSVGEVAGTVVASAIEGDADQTGDQLVIAQDVGGTFTALAGPNNPEDNFFCSQLNDSAGELDVSGTFGDANHDATSANLVGGGRQGWDVTTVELSSVAGELVAGQTHLVLRALTVGDSFVPAMTGIAIDVNAPRLGGGTSSFAAEPATVTLGETFTVTATAENTGTAVADGLEFALELPIGLSLVSFTSDGDPGDVDGAPVDASGLANGVAEGTLAPGEARALVLSIEVVGSPPTDIFELFGAWSYDYTSCAGDPLADESASFRTVVTFVDPPHPDAGSGADGGTDAGIDGGPEAGGPEYDAGSGDPADTERGCSCYTAGRPTEPAALAPLVVVVALIVGIRRRRSRWSLSPR